MVTDHEMRMEALRLFEENDRLRDSLSEERKTVDRIWSALGISTYAAAGGLAIFEIIAKQRDALKRVNHTLDLHGKIDGETDLHNFIRKALDPTYCGESINEDPSGQRREPMSPHPLDDEARF